MDATESLPAGPIAALFPTIEGSTRLWERPPEVLPAVPACTAPTPRSTPP